VGHHREGFGYLSLRVSFIRSSPPNGDTQPMTTKKMIRNPKKNKNKWKISARVNLTRFCPHLRNTWERRTVRVQPTLLGSLSLQHRVELPSWRGCCWNPMCWWRPTYDSTLQMFLVHSKAYIRHFVKLCI
jgi:hypothetical protein